MHTHTHTHTHAHAHTHTHTHTHARTHAERPVRRPRRHVCSRAPAAAAGIRARSATGVSSFTAVSTRGCCSSAPRLPRTRPQAAAAPAHQCAARGRACTARPEPSEARPSTHARQPARSRVRTDPQARRRLAHEGRGDRAHGGAWRVPAAARRRARFAEVPQNRSRERGRLRNGGDARTSLPQRQCLGARRRQVLRARDSAEVSPLPPSPPSPPLRTHKRRQTSKQTN